MALDLNDGTSQYLCGEESSQKRLSSKFKLEELPRDDLAKKLSNLVEEKVDVNDTFKFSRCKGHLCNKKKESTIQCYSSPSVDEKTHTLYPITSQLDDPISCPINITQCYRYGKYEQKLSYISILWTKKGQYYLRGQLFGTVNVKPF